VHAAAESLAFPNGRFDRVVSQFGFMFFEDKLRALQEMRRVLRPGGKLAVAVCDSVDRSPGYAVFAELLHRLFGHAVAESFRAPFALGDPARLLHMCALAAIPGAEVARQQGLVRFPSIEALVATEGACVWTLGGVLDGEQLDRLREEAQGSMHGFLTAEGALEFEMPALVISATAAS
jgi:SAM-dependent methyltransferase